MVSYRLTVKAIVIRTEKFVPELNESTISEIVPYPESMDNVGFENVINASETFDSNAHVPLGRLVTPSAYL
jgi:hypothetical protein